MSGKGSSPRPFSVDRGTFDNNWDRIFGSDKPAKEHRELDEKEWDAYSGLPNPDAYRKDDDASKS